MDKQKQILHFTLGPVQGFIGDARRTRDLWAGSFLLSWLSGHAMSALEMAGGKIIFPLVAGDHLFEAVHHKKTDNMPYVGSLPNRFKADVTKVKLPDGVRDAGELCRNAVEKNWKQIEAAVYRQFIARIANKQTKEIWDRQVNSFWNINWVIGDKTDDDGRWLDQRKNWRTHVQPDEGGDLCRLMGFYQEISGFDCFAGKDGQKAFWDDLSKQEYKHVSNGKNRQLRELNLREDERLCSVALIKRLFPLIAKETIGWLPGGDAVNIVNWPSISYIAAVPWLKKINEEQSKAYFKIVKDNIEKNFRGEVETRLFGLPNGGVFDLDGHLLHEDGIRACDANDKEKEDATLIYGEASRKNLLAGLSTLNKAVDCSASEFYAVLIMDGDNIGAQIGDKPNTITNGLSYFTKSVKEYFDPTSEPKNPLNGVLIYAGGDDVLALVPVDGVIEAALDLRDQYQKAFNKSIEESSEYGKIGEFTMSAAIVFAQYKVPLRAVMKKAHHYLDGVAKDQNGRDSLALAVMKPGGIAFDWVSCWDKPVSDLQAAQQKVGSDYSNSFLYNIRERYAPLFEDNSNGDEQNRDKITGQDRSIERVFAEPGFMENVLVAEYKKQPRNSKLDVQTVKNAIAPLLSIGQPLYRTKDKESKHHEHYEFDGALIARFLSVESRPAKDVKGDGDEY